MQQVWSETSFKTKQSLNTNRQKLCKNISLIYITITLVRCFNGMHRTAKKNEIHELKISIPDLVYIVIASDKIS